jgi:hypothetical protein
VERKPATGLTFEDAKPAVENYVRDNTGRELLKEIKTSGQQRIIVNLGGVPEKYTKNLPLKKISP